MRPGAPTFLMIAGALAGAFAGDPFEISWSSVDGGGGRSGAVDQSGNPIALTGSIGQHDAGVLTDGLPSPEFTLTGGVLVDFFVACPGDTNGDRVIDFLDLNNCLSDFGLSASGLAGDLNRDGVSDFLDLNLCLSFFGSGC